VRLFWAWVVLSVIILIGTEFYLRHALHEAGDVFNQYDKDSGMPCQIH
jgi:hypothetical protein